MLNTVPLVQLCPKLMRKEEGTERKRKRGGKEKEKRTKEVERSVNKLIANIKSSHCSSPESPPIFDTSTTH